MTTTPILLQCSVRDAPPQCYGSTAARRQHASVTVTVVSAGGWVSGQLGLGKTKKKELVDQQINSIHMIAPQQLIAPIVAVATKNEWVLALLILTVRQRACTPTGTNRCFDSEGRCMLVAATPGGCECITARRKYSQ